MSSISDAQIRAAIREILRGADLSSLSSKLVRKKLEEKFHTDLTARKQEIDDILMSLINAMGDDVKHEQESSDDEEHDEEESKLSASATSSLSKNGTLSIKMDPDMKPSISLNVDPDDMKSAISQLKRSPPFGSSSDSDASDDILDKVITSAKKRRNLDAQTRGGEPSTSEDEGVDDEAYARKLQQQELRVRPRSSKQKAEKKTKSTKSTASEGSDRKKGNSVYSQECVLSPELAAVMGTDRLARKDVVSRMWKIFKERDLMDPANRQFVICDEQLEKVFKVKKFKAFSMMKILKTHIKDAKDVL